MKHQIVILYSADGHRANKIRVSIQYCMYIWLVNFWKRGDFQTMKIKIVLFGIIYKHLQNVFLILQNKKNTGLTFIQKLKSKIILGLIVKTGTVVMQGKWSLV